MTNLLGDLDSFLTRHQFSSFYKKKFQEIERFNESYFIIEENPFSASYFLSVLATLDLGKTAILFNPMWSNEEKHLRAEELNDQNISGDLILYTSGSSGGPKGVIHTKESLFQSIQSSLNFFSMKEGEVSLVSLPQHHIGGLMIGLRALVSGGNCLFPEDSKSIQSYLKKYSVDYLSLVPTQLKELLKIEKLIEIKAIILGGAPISRELWDEATSLELSLYQTFGMSESAAMVMAHGPDEFNFFTPLPGRDIRLNQDGLLEIGSYGLMSGYLNYDACFTGDGYFKTSDHFLMKGKGYCFQSRKDLTIISGGENIDPLEIENLIQGMSQIVSFHIIPKDDPKWGQIPIAYVEPFSYSEDVKKKIESSLHRYKWPVEYRPYPEHLKNKIEQKIKIPRGELSP